MAGKRLRFPTSPPKSLQEQFERDRELTEQLERKVLASVRIRTTETAVAHGLGEVPGVVNWGPPHCIAVVRMTRPPDNRCVYLRATNECVVDVEVSRAFPDPPRVPGGGYDLPDWDPGGSGGGSGGADDHLVKATDADTTTVGGLYEKTRDSSTITRRAVTDTDGVQKVEFNAVPADPSTVGARLFTAAIPPPNALTANAVMAPIYRWNNVACVLIGPGVCYPDPFAGFVQISPGVWKRTVTGTLPTNFTDGVDLLPGMRILANPGGMLTEDLWKGSIYNCDSVGGPSDYVQFSRDADADESSDYVFGKVVNVVFGTTYGGTTFVYTGATSPTVGTDSLTFICHGTTSIYKDVPNGECGFGTVWTPTTGISTWQKNGEGGLGVPAPPSATRWLETETLPGGEVAVGKAFVVREATPYGGIYEVQTYGTQQIIRRIDAANEPAELAQMVALITGVSSTPGEIVWCRDGYWRQTETIATIDVTPTDWMFTSDPPIPPTDELLTGSQLITEGASSETITTYKMVGNSDGPSSLWQYPLATLAGTPGISELPAGRESCQIGSAYVEGWNPSTNPGQVTVAMRIRNHTTGDTLFTAPCGVLLTTSPQRLAWQYDFSPAVSVAPTDTLDINIVITSTTATQVKVVVEYNSAARDTWVQLAGVQFSVAGTDDHRLLTQESRESARQHPKFSIDDAPGTVSVSAAPAKLTISSKARSAEMTIAAALSVYGIVTDGWNQGDELILFVDGCTPAAPLTLKHLGASDGSQVYVGVNLSTGAGQDAAYVRPVVLQLKRRSNHWRLMNAKM